MYHIAVETILRPSRWVLVLALLFLLGFGALAVYGIIRHGDLTPLVFILFAAVFASLLLVGNRSWLALQPGSIQQHSPFTKRQTWRFEAEEIDAWSEISLEEAHWLALCADDRDRIGEPNLTGWSAKYNRYIFFRLCVSGEVIHVQHCFSSGKQGEHARAWLQEHVGDPLTGEDGLHWHIDKARDKRCYVERALPDSEAENH